MVARLDCAEIQMADKTNLVSLETAFSVAADTG
jgi:hypothetical protein